LTPLYRWKSSGSGKANATVSELSTSGLQNAARGCISEDGLESSHKEHSTHTVHLFTGAKATAPKSQGGLKIRGVKGRAGFYAASQWWLAVFEA
jgi:hypothetical protein